MSLLKKVGYYDKVVIDEANNHVVNIIKRIREVLTGDFEQEDYHNLVEYLFEGNLGATGNFNLIKWDIWDMTENNDEVDEAIRLLMENWMEFMENQSKG